MGAASSIDLRPEELGELAELTGFTPKEIRSLYQRFRKLDRGNKGTITTDDLLMIPELSMNPLAPRIVALFDSENEGQINFSFFLSVLSVFAARTGTYPKQKFLFAIWDVDGDGMISVDDMRHVLWMMVGNRMSREEIQDIINRCFRAAGARPHDHLSMHQFEMVTQDLPLSDIFSLSFTTEDYCFDDDDFASGPMELRFNRDATARNGIATTS